MAVSLHRSGSGRISTRRANILPYLPTYLDHHHGLFGYSLQENGVMKVGRMDQGTVLRYTQTQPTTSMVRQTFNDGVMTMAFQYGSQ